LPPVIDITKLIVDTPSVPATAPTPTQAPTSTPLITPTPKTASNPQPNPVIPAISSQSSSTQSNYASQSANSQSANTATASSQPTPAPATSNLQTNSPPPKQPGSNTNPSIPASQQPSAPSNYVAIQTSQNEVYIAPVVTPSNKPDNIPQQKPTPSPTYSPVPLPPNPSSSNIAPPARTNDSSPFSYQCWNSNKEALYNITPSYKAFSKYFIIAANDEFLPNIQSYLLGNYGNYLSGSQIVAGFRIYNSYGDNSLDYQVLYSTNFGTFISILTYWPDTANIQLKSLSILNFYIMEIDYSNCQQQDPVQQNCKICNDGYRNFFGRCEAYDPSCIDYITDECRRCGNGKRLSSGICQ
jgi:hypothetical protein